MDNSRIKYVRIGDWMMFNGDAKQVTSIERIDATNGNSVYLICCDSGQYHEKCVDEIQLVPDMLDKNGFKSMVFPNFEGQQHHWILWFNTIHYIDIWCKNLKDDPSNGWVCKIETDRANGSFVVNTVSDLQHILSYFGHEKADTFMLTDQKEPPDDDALFID